MHRETATESTEATATSALARAIGTVAQTDGDYATAVPALTLHRRSAPTQPLHWIYTLGLGVIAQGSKQVMLGGQVIAGGLVGYESASQFSRECLRPTCDSRTR